MHVRLSRLEKWDGDVGLGGLELEDVGRGTRGREHVARENVGTWGRWM